MKFKIKKDLFLKKSTWVVLGIFAITLVNIPRFKTQATGTKDSLNFEPDVIKVLEIAPGNEYSLTTSKINPNENEYLEASTGEKVKVTHINMSKFISMIDDITGEYDVVAITNEKSNLPSEYKSDNMYRQYTSPFSQSIGFGKYMASEWKVGPYNLDGTGYKEYYSENDITNKRAKLIIDMINKGQLVYIDTTATNVSGTKLSTIFNGQGVGSGITSKSNFKKVAGSEISINKIVDDYKALNKDNKRVKVNSASIPVSEKINEDGTVTNERTLNFSINANAEVEEQLTINLYLDFDGDGLFTGKPYKSFPIQGINGAKDYSFSAAINNGFIGYLGWKVEVVRPNGVKTNIQSYAIYHAQNGKKDIRVLQIYPNTDTFTYFDNRNGTKGSGSTRLSQNKTFTDMLSQLKDYNVTIEDISAKEFSEQYGNTKTLKDNYDMVIVGFADYYAGADINSDAALADLDAFIANGKSVMFTHDTIGLGILGKSNGPNKFAQHYKDIVGQSRYDDVFRTETTNLYTNKYDDGTIAKTTIPHDVSNGKTLGQTALAMDGVQSQNQTGTRLWEQTQTNIVKNINNAQITTYPYNLLVDDNKKTRDDSLNVSLTHTQWYQLNLEDPDIVPWYNLSGGNMDDGDSRNFYYTYSKGNITYSGTGHSCIGTEKDELELFVNTIIKAERGSNAAPTVKNYTDSNVSNEILDKSTVKNKISKDNDYTFYVVPNDVDNDKLQVTIETLGKTIKSVSDYTGNEPIEVIIPKEDLASLNKGDNFDVNVTAVDPLGEKGTASFKLVCDGNQAPDITNMKGEISIDNNQEVNAPRTAEYTFTTIPTDPDDEDKDNLTVSVKVDGQEILKKDEVKTGSKIDVTIPEDLLAGKQTGDKVTVETTVNDNHGTVNEPNGKSATKKFVLVIDAEIPHTNLSIVESVDENGVFKEVPTDATFANLETVKLAGKITSVYDNAGVISLEIPKCENVQGDVTVRRLINGKLSDTVWTMVKDNSNIGPNVSEYYTLDLAAVNPLSLGAVDKGGMQFIVQYDVKLDDTEKVLYAKEHPIVENSEPVIETTYEEDGTRVEITKWTKTTTWKYDGIYLNQLKFTGSDNIGIANVKMHMGKKTVLPKESSPNRFPPKKYGYPNLF